MAIIATNRIKTAADIEVVVNFHRESGRGRRNLYRKYSRSGDVLT